MRGKWNSLKIPLIYKEQVLKDYKLTLKTFDWVANSQLKINMLLIILKIWNSFKSIPHVWRLSEDFMHLFSVKIHNSWNFLCRKLQKILKVGQSLSDRMSLASYLLVSNRLPRVSSSGSRGKWYTMLDSYDTCFIWTFYSPNSLFLKVLWSTFRHFSNVWGPWGLILVNERMSTFFACY